MLTPKQAMQNSPAGDVTAACFTLVHNIMISILIKYNVNYMRASYRYLVIILSACNTCVLIILCVHGPEIRTLLFDSTVRISPSGVTIELACSCYNIMYMGMFKMYMYRCNKYTLDTINRQISYMCT